MLTPLQGECLAAIIAHQRAHGGVPPTYRDLAAALGCSASCAWGYVTGLHERGYVRMGSSAHSIRVLKTADGAPIGGLAMVRDADLIAEVCRRWPDLADRLGVAGTGRAAERGAQCGRASVGAGDLELGTMRCDARQDIAQNIVESSHEEPPASRGTTWSRPCPDIRNSLPERPET